MALPLGALGLCGPPSSLSCPGLRRHALELRSPGFWPQSALATTCPHPASLQHPIFAPPLPAAGPGNRQRGLGWGLLPKALTKALQNRMHPLGLPSLGWAGGPEGWPPGLLLWCLRPQRPPTSYGGSGTELTGQEHLVWEEGCWERLKHRETHRRGLQMGPGDGMGSQFGSLGSPGTGLPEGGQGTRVWGPESAPRSLQRHGFGHSTEQVSANKGPCFGVAAGTGTLWAAHQACLCLPPQQRDKLWPPPASVSQSATPCSEMEALKAQAPGTLDPPAP